MNSQFPSPHPSALIPVHGRVLNPRLLKPPAPQETRVTVPARPPLTVWVVAGVRQRIVDAEIPAAANDVGFCQLDQRGDDRRLATFDPALRAAKDHLLKGVDEFRTAIGVAAVINRV